MFKKGTKAYSVFNNKCPKCQEGDFFKNKISYTPSKVTKIHDNCPKCDLKYMLEPSFFLRGNVCGLWDYGCNVCYYVFNF